MLDKPACITKQNACNQLCKTFSPDKAFQQYAEPYDQIALSSGNYPIYLLWASYGPKGHHSALPQGPSQNVAREQNSPHLKNLITLSPTQVIIRILTTTQAKL